MQTTNLQRRSFLRGKSPRLEPDTIRPPWAIEASQFIEKCIRCDDCITACPEKIINRGDGGYPEINFIKGECTFCAKCAEACEAGAFENRPTEELDSTFNSSKPWHLHVNFETTCLSLNAVVCRSCSENCDEDAINFQLKLGGISEPLFTQENCTGCGACVSVCPVHAIQIKPAVEQNKP